MTKVAILLGFGFIMLLLAVRRLRRYRLKERYTLLFVFSALPFLGLAIWPGAIGWLGKQLDISYPTVALLCVSGFFILMIFELLTIVSTQDRRINTLAQIVGVMMERHGMSDRDIFEGPAPTEPSVPVLRSTSTDDARPSPVNTFE